MLLELFFALFANLQTKSQRSEYSNCSLNFGLFTCFLSLMRSSFSRLIAASLAASFRASLRLWKPVKYSFRAEGSNVSSSGWSARSTLLLLKAGAMILVCEEKSKCSWEIFGEVEPDALKIDARRSDLPETSPSRRHLWRASNNEHRLARMHSSAITTTIKC